MIFVQFSQQRFRVFTLFIYNTLSIIPFPWNTEVYTMGNKSSKKKKASQAKAVKQAKTAQPEQPVTSADSDNFESKTTVQIAEQGKKITLRQDSVPYNKTAIQRRKEAAKNPGVVREGTATEDLLATIQANKKSLKCKFSVLEKRPTTKNIWHCRGKYQILYLFHISHLSLHITFNVVDCLSFLLFFHH